MFRSYGLYTHIQANRIRSILLLAGFVLLLHALLFSILVYWIFCFAMSKYSQWLERDLARGHVR